jgi:hypothetical protein
MCRQPSFHDVATDDFRIVRDNLDGGNRTTQGRLVPFCIFTDPEFARVGLNESETQKRGVPYRLTRIPMTKVRRTVTFSETRGFLKALISDESDEILGLTAFGAEAGEVMSVVQTAMLARMPYTSLRDAILAHPTMAEGLTVPFAAVPDRFDCPHYTVLARRTGATCCCIKLIMKCLHPSKANRKCSDLSRTTTLKSCDRRIHNRLRPIVSRSKHAASLLFGH